MPSVTTESCARRGQRRGHLGRYGCLETLTREWTEQLERTERIATSTAYLPELDGLGPPAPGDPEAFEAWVGRLVADHVEPALVKAHDEMGDGRRAVAMAIRWLTPAFGPSATGT